MSLQRSTGPSARTAACVRNTGDKTGVFQKRAEHPARRIEHLPVFKDFSGRLYHLAVSVKRDQETRSRDAKP